VLARFLLSVILFHVGYAAACLWVFLRWRARWDSGRPAPRLWGAAAAAPETMALCLIAVLLSVIATAVAFPDPFAVVRLLAQGLFGETLILGVALVVLLARRNRLPLAGALALAPLLLLAVYVDAYHVEPHDLQVRHHTVRAARLHGAVRILHISDTQVDGVGPYEERALREGLALRPDLIVLTGDYAQPRVGSRPEGAERAFADLLRRIPLSAPLGVYAVRGDVDDDWPEPLAGAGITLLADEAVSLDTGGERLTLVGLSPAESRGANPGLLARLVRSAPPGHAVVVAGHSPDFVSALAGRATVDLALAGHTHGGQVVLPVLGAPITLSRLPRRYVSGLHDYHGIALHVSAGVGMERGAAPQIRFLCRPEICLVELGGATGRPGR
jgi:predicted MPP superfamily phosphohydrolase